MRIALVHDYLTQPGGGERVVLQLAELFPGAPIYTALYEPETTFPEFANYDVRTSPLQGNVDADDFRRSVLRYPRAFQGFDLDDYDLVVVSSSAFAHHVRHPAAYVYCHTPPRFLYDPATYVGERFAPILGAAGLPLRRADRSAARSCAGYVANSKITASRIKARYGIEAPVIHPPLWTAHLPAEVSPIPAVPRALTICRLLPYKRADLAVEAAKRAGIGLTVVGDGPERARLEALAGDHDVSFLGRVDDDELRALWETHSVAIVPGLEDFGFAPVEANYSGRPTVALDAGGALETVNSGVTGLRVSGTDPDAWGDTLRQVIDTTWDPHQLRAESEKFSGERFDRQLLEWIGITREEAASMHANP